jgi:hypothetical protein
MLLCAMIAYADTAAAVCDGHTVAFSYKQLCTCMTAKLIEEALT